ncbi:RNA polymerase sigma-70 factor (ECF subfamily) [Rhizobium sp. BE258]|nr:sigma-70 family RNA polymerase sigma factor [Rhizobium sp. BE258]MDR7146308.1 RNA polymerase sigma-70 factor (ECF subfamily) [Rhizobium sp. BE258]
MTEACLAFPTSFDDQLAAALLRWRRRSRSFSQLASCFLAEAASVLVGYMEMALANGGQQAAAASEQPDHTLRFQQNILPHMDAAYNFARFLSRDQDAAQDIVQDAFLRAYRSFETYRGGDSRAWIFAIVRNCHLAWQQQGRRKARFEMPLDGDAGGDSPAHEIASDDDTAETAMIRESETSRVRHVIGLLPEAMREILVLRELEELSYKQIAEVIDVPIGTVMSRIARARREFGEAWDAFENGAVRA